MRIALVGLGRLGLTALEGVLELGADVSIADSRPVDREDLERSWFPRDAVGWPRAEAAARRLTDRSEPVGQPGRPPEVRAVPEPGSRAAGAGSWLAGHDLCVLTMETVARRVAESTNAACIEHAVPMFPAFAMGEVAQMGPLVEADGPCLECADLRMRAATGRACLDARWPPQPELIAHLAAVLATRVVDLLEPAEVDSTVDFLWADGTTARHPLLRSRHCRACAGRGEPMPFARAGAPPRDVPADAGRILAVKDRLVDDITGPVISLERFVPPPGEPAISHWNARLADPGWLLAGESEVLCGGSALDDASAAAAGLGEALERAAAVMSVATPFERAPLERVADAAVDPSAWDVFDETTRALPGFPYVRPAADSDFDWVWGFCLVESRPVRVPASRVFTNYGAADVADEDIALLSGFAAGSSPEQATLGGLLEVLERDAFMIAWANRLAWRPLAIDPRQATLGRLVAAFDAPGLEMRCGSITLDTGCPLVIAILRSTRHGDPAAVVSCACDLDVGGAAARALIELTANRHYVKSLSQAGGANPGPGQPLTTDEDHARLYARPEMFDRLAFWWDSAEEAVAVRDPQPDSHAGRAASADLEVLLGRLHEAALRALVVDLTAPEVRDLGLYTVKGLIPGTYPMDFDSRWPHLGGARLREAPVVAGLRSRPLNREELCVDPHPFP